MEHTQLFKAFEYWAQNWVPPTGTKPVEKMKLEQEYLEYLVDQMGER